MPNKIKTLSCETEVGELLGGWVGVMVEVLVRGRDSDAWLARFAGRIEQVDHGAHVEINVGGPEAWVKAVPMYFTDAVLYDNGVLTVRHEGGETTIRTESATLPARG